MADYTNPSPTVTQGISNAFELMFHDDLNRNFARRLQAYRKYWLFYLGKHWSYVRDPGEPTLTFNYCRRILDLHTDFTFKGAFKTIIPDDPATPENEQETREFVRLMLDETWRKNQQKLWCMDMGQQGGVTGDVFGRVSWDKTNPIEDPFARVDIIPSHLCFPEFGGPHGVDRKKLKRILIVNPVYRNNDRGPIAGVFFTRKTKNQGALELVIESEEWTAPVYDEKTGKLIQPAMQIFYRDKEKIWEKVNPLGEIPVVHIPNYPLSGEFYGISDLVDAVELNRELNEKATDISDIINYHGSPTTILTGAKLAALEKGANRIWGLPDGANVFNLELTGDLGAATAHWQTLKEVLLELTNTPEQALGKTQAVSNTSGVALQIQYLPMMEKRDVKVLTYGSGIRLINRLLLKTTELADPAFQKKMSKLKGNPYRNDVIFADPMPQDELRELEKAILKLDAGLSTRRRELEKLGHSQAEASAILDDAAKEMEEDTESMFGAGTGVDMRGKKTAQRGGAPETRGAKIVATQQKKTTTGK